jgi:peptide/nickel transport system substrate-binding protein
MKRLSLYILTIGLLGLLVIPGIAQDETEFEGEGFAEGGVIVESNIGDDPSTFIPIISSDATSSDVWGFFYPGIIAGDDETFVATPNQRYAMAAGWEYDESGTVLTISLREDLFWSDGTPVTADDYLWSYNATKSGRSGSVRTNVLYQLDDGTKTGGAIFDVVKVDDYTLEVSVGTASEDEDGNLVEILPDCIAINEINDITPVPAHVYDPVFGDNYEELANDPYFIPVNQETGDPVGVGMMYDPFMEFGIQVSLLANPEDTDALLGYVSPREWLLQQVENQTIEYERFLAGEFTTIGVSANNQNDMRARAEAEGYQLIEYPANGYTYMAMNEADPSNPQNGRDADGNLIDQGLHPFFGDLRVREAVGMAINVREMIGTFDEESGQATGILEGNGYEIATHDHPGLGTVDHGIEPQEFDPEAALALLSEAGWIDNDGDGVLECNGCLYATEVDPSYEGTPASFELLTNSGNVIREGTGETIQAQLAEIGVTVDFQAIEFGTLVQELLGQTYDAIIIGWSLGLPYEPGSSIPAIFGIGNDRVGAGFNTTSMQDAEMERLLDEANTLEGCDPEARNELYAEAMRMLTENRPYVWLFAGNAMVATQPGIENFDPLPYNTQWNMDTWVIRE